MATIISVINIFESLRRYIQFVETLAAAYDTGKLSSKCWNRIASQNIELQTLTMLSKFAVLT